MLDFVVVDRPAIMPMSCIATGDTSGKMVDTQRELRGIGRIYISQRAVIQCARAFGLVKGGKRYEEILSAMQSLEEREAEIAALELKVSQLSELVGLQVKQLEEHDRYRDWAEGRIDQLRNAALVGAEAMASVAAG